MLLQKSKENRYRHYKGGIYYKLAEPFVVNAFNEEATNMRVIDEYCFKYETTGDIGTLYITNTGVVFFTFDDRKPTQEEFKLDYVWYESEDTGLYWIRTKEEFEGFTEVNGEKIKRFTLANA